LREPLAGFPLGSVAPAMPLGMPHLPYEYCNDV